MHLSSCLLDHNGAWCTFDPGMCHRTRLRNIHIGSSSTLMSVVICTTLKWDTSQHPLTKQVKKNYKRKWKSEKTKGERREIERGCQLCKRKWMYKKHFSFLLNNQQGLCHMGLWTTKISLSSQIYLRCQAIINIGTRSIPRSSCTQVLDASRTVS